LPDDPIPLLPDDDDIFLDLATTYLHSVVRRLGIHPTTPITRDSVRHRKSTAHRKRLVEAFFQTEI